MPAIALRKEIAPPKTSPPLPAVTPEKFDTGYKRAVAPAWTIEAMACIAGLLVFVAAWAAIAKFGGRIPDPVTVGIGFGLAALVGIPLGFMIGRFRFLSGMAAPIIALLKPVSPLAWLPIGLLVFKAANPAAIWVIFICSLWPMIVNTAVGVRQIPQDYLNVARVLNLSEWKVFTKILFPAVLPYMITGVRLSIGVAWLVIVAAEMLTGGVGIGFWVWDEWNNLKVEHIMIAIFTIGIVGLLLEQGLVLVARRFSYG
jgi:nitrate/nitrite transport system permease protein